MKKKNNCIDKKQAFERKLKEDRDKIKIADGCYVTFCWPPVGD